MKFVAILRLYFYKVRDETVLKTFLFLPFDFSVSLPPHQVLLINKPHPKNEGGRGLLSMKQNYQMAAELKLLLGEN